MTTNDTCPHCGAKSHDEFKFLCGTEEILVGLLVRASGCYERQIKQQAAEIEKLKLAVLDMPKQLE